MEDFDKVRYQARRTAEDDFLTGRKLISRDKAGNDWDKFYWERITELCNDMGSDDLFVEVNE